MFYKISIHDFKAETKPVVKDARTNLLDEIAKGKQLKVKNSKLLNNFQFIIFQKTVINQNKTPTNQIAGNSMIDSVQQMLEQRRAAIDSGKAFVKSLKMAKAKTFSKLFLDSDDSDDSDAWDE